MRKNYPLGISLRYAATLLVLLLSTLAATAQTLHGRVTDGRTGEPVIGALVQQKEAGRSTVGAATDADGRFVLAVKEVPTVIVVSFTGYRNEEIDIYEVTADEVDIALTESFNLVQGVVVTALGKEKSVDKTGTTQSVIDPAQITKAGTATLINALSGKASGVKISSPNGEPGMGSNIIIRGANTFIGDSQPLVILDGTPISNDNSGSTSYAQQSHLNDLNPNDIESMQVLKGASAAALWGSRAANGVIVITTKSGAKASRPHISYSFSKSFDWISDHHPLQSTWGQGTGGQYNKNSNYSWGDKISERSGAPDVLNTSGGYFVGSVTGKTYYPITQKNSRETYIDSNFDAVFRTGGFTKHDVSLSGGGDRASYYLSYGGMFQDGIVRTAYYNKHNVRLNATYRFADWLKASAKTAYIYTTTNRVASNGDSSNGVYLGLLRTPADFDNTDYIGTYVAADGVSYTDRQRMYRNEIGANSNPTYNNPLWAVYQQSNTQKTDRFIITPQVEIDPLRWLNVTLRGGLDYYTTVSDEYYPINSQGATNSKGYYSSGTATNKELTFDAIVRASHDFSRNVKLTGTLGYSINDRQTTSNSGSVTPFDVQTDIQSSSLASSTSAKNWSKSITHTRNNRGFVIIEAELLGQLFLSATAMQEASSTVSGTYFYPSADVAWQFTKLWKPWWLSFGKLRAAWGKVGTSPAPYRTETLASSTNGAFGGSYAVSSLKGNADIKPEVKTEWEIGADLRFLRDRVELKATYYRNHIDDLLYSVTLNPSSGYTSIYANGGKMENWGIELDATWRIFDKKDFAWSLNANWSKNKNEVTQLNGTGLLNISSTSVALEGYPLGVLYRPGVLRDAAGQPILDHNGFPQLSTGNVVLGDPNPEWRGGLGMDVRYKDFDFSFLFEHSHGGKYINRTQLTLYGFGVHQDVEGEVTLPYDVVNYNGQVFHAGETVRGNLYDFGAGTVLLDESWYTGIGGGLGINKVHDYYVQDNTWTKLRNITLGYTWHSQWLKRNTQLLSVRFSVTGRDLLVWDKLVGIDPESNNYGVGLAQGMDYFSSPATRSVLFTVEIKY
ncbi:MAG: SusC/RagA family TonB-linked outer membrane protein [Prevotella sp.]|nr:SusC/RagA family TonB-linked outer membrane protein [Prevotella sp.]